MRRAWIMLAALLLLGLGLALGRGRPTSVQVVQPSRQHLAEVLALSGRVRGVEESRIAPEIQATVRSIPVREGQVVGAGQVLAQLDGSRLKAQFQQAENRVRVAEAQLLLARRGPLASQFEEVQAQVQGQQKAAAAALESARQRWLEAQRGPRAEQVRQAQALLRETRAEAEQKAVEARRYRELYQQNALSRLDLEKAETLASRALQQQEQARFRLQELENGTRPEQLEQARQAWRSAQAEYQSALQAGQARLQQLEDQPRVEDVVVAEAQLAEARSARKVAQEQLALATLRAPYAGTVGRKLLRPGDLAGPNQPVLTFSSQPLEIRVEVDESDRARLQAGQRARIRAQGFEGEFDARLQEMAAEVDSLRGTIEARLKPIQAPAWVLPGQTVDVNLILGEAADRWVIPLTCVMLRGESSQVLVVEGGVVKSRQVQLSSPTQQGYLVRAGLSDRDRVVLYPQGLQEGQKVRPRAL